MLPLTKSPSKRAGAPALPRALPTVACECGEVAVNVDGDEGGVFLTCAVCGSPRGTVEAEHLARRPPDPDLDPQQLEARALPGADEEGWHWLGFLRDREGLFQPVARAETLEHLWDLMLHDWSEGERLAIRQRGDLAGRGEDDEDAPLPLPARRPAPKARVTCAVRPAAFSEGGRWGQGVEVACGQCGHRTRSFGKGAGSVRRCLVLLREGCPQRASNYYHVEGY